MPSARRLCKKTTRNIYLMHFMNASILFPKVSTTITIKNAIERHCIGFCSALVTLGRYCEQRQPSKRGIPKRMMIVLNISRNGISSSGRIILFSAKLRYIFPQKEKLSGVVIMQAAVLNAVNETDSSVLPRENEVMKLDIFPPGQAATRIIPSAIIGDIQSFNKIVSRKVNAGSSMIWHIIPSIIDFGLRTISRKDEGLMPKATPNITKARTILIMSMPVLFILTFIASSEAIISGLISYPICVLINNQVYATKAEKRNIPKVLVILPFVPKMKGRIAAPIITA